jgi:Concanavalin A-like lectin/glucanases superfamily
MALEIGGGINIEGGITITPETVVTATWSWDPAYLGPVLALGNNNNTVFDTNQGYTSALGTKELSTSGLTMFSVTLNFDYDGPHPIQYLLGIGNHNTDLTTGLGSNTNSYGIGTDGNIYYAGTTVVTGLPTWGTPGDVLDIAINPASNSLWFRVNGGLWNGNPAADPATNALGNEIPNGPYYPAITVAGEFGPSEFTIEPTAQYTVPAGFTFLAGTEETGLMLNLDAGDFASVGYFGFGSNTWIDISGYNNNATFTNGNLQGGGAPNSHFVFDGSGSSYATINWSPSMSPTSQISWETWVYSDTNTSGDGDYHWIVRNGWAGAPWYHGLNTSGQWLLVINDHGYDTTGPQLTAGWHQIVGTYDGNFIRMYVDGTYAGTLTGASTGIITGYNMSIPTIIGGGSDTGNGVPPPNQQFWDGGIAVIKMFDTQLSPSAISANFQALKSRYGL